MIGNHRVLALVPARGGSKGLPRKNVRLLAGRPLVAWPVAAAKGATCIDRIVVSTDDSEIAAAALSAGADVPFTRPAHLADDSASSASVVCHALQTLEQQGERYGYIVLLEPTSPLTDSSDIDAALQTLYAARERADAIVGVARLEAFHPEYTVRLADDALISPYAASGFDSLRRRQELDELYYLEGSLYASSVAVFRQRQTFHHDRTLGFVVPRWKSLEVDELMDFICIEALLQHKSELAA